MRTTQSKPSKQARKPLNRSGKSSVANTRRSINKLAGKLADLALAIPRVPPLPKIAERGSGAGPVEGAEWRLSGTMNPPTESFAVEGARERTLPFREVVEAFELCDDLIHSNHFPGDVGSCCCADVATFVWNQGSTEDQVEALLALIPIAHRVFKHTKARDRAAAGTPLNI